MAFLIKKLFLKARKLILKPEKISTRDFTFCSNTEVQLLSIIQYEQDDLHNESGILTGTAERRRTVPSLTFSAKLILFPISAFF